MLKLVVSGVSVSFSLMQNCFLGRVEGCDHFCISSVQICKLIRENIGNALPTVRFQGMECLSSSQDIFAGPHLFALKFRLIFHLLAQLHWVTPTYSLCCDRICLILCLPVTLGLSGEKGKMVRKQKEWNNIRWIKVLVLWFSEFFFLWTLQLCQGLHRKKIS